MSESSGLSSTQRIGHYSPLPAPDEEDVGYNTARLTSRQRRRAIHKARGPEHETLANPGRWQPMGRRSAYLNPEQFMLMSDVRKMPGIDQGGGPVSALIPRKQAQVELNMGSSKDYPALVRAMRKGGPAGKQVPPVHIARGPDIYAAYGGSTGWGLDTPGFALGNGGHRVAIADQLGWTAVPYTTHKMQSGYQDFRGFRKDEIPEVPMRGMAASSGSSGPPDKSRTIRDIQALLAPAHRVMRYSDSG